VRTVTIAALLCVVTPVLAQSPPGRRSPAADDVIKLRYEIQLVERRLPAFEPGLILFSAPVRARGFRLDGYGFFFDVEVPGVRRSMLWSMRMLDRSLASALQEMRRELQALRDEPTRASLERMLQRLEEVQRPEVTVAGAGVRGSPPAPEPQGAAGVSQEARDPRQVYLAELTDAILDALLRHGGSLPLADDEWLAIGLREGFYPFGPGDLSELRTTTLRMRGRDLAEWRAGRLSLEEARRRLDTREF